jgi:hypothetical protein
MKKFVLVAMALTLALSAAPAFAKGKAAKKAKAPTWQCTVGGNTVMTATVEECMKQGGMVQNYPGPDKAAPAKAKMHKKMKKAATAAPAKAAPAKAAPAAMPAQ